MDEDPMTSAGVEAIARRVFHEERESKRRPVLTTKTAAEYCGMSAQSLYNLISEGNGPVHYKHGRRNAFYESDLDAWNDARLTEVQ